MLLRLDESVDEPIYARIGSAIRRGIAKGEIAPGDRLPAARSLAEELDVNMHTVLRAYGNLRDDGLIELRRGRGATVADTAASQPHGRFCELVDGLIAEAKRRGKRISDVHEVIEERW